MKSIQNRYLAWLKNAQSKFGERFDYAKSENMYRSTVHPKVNITCILHGEEFLVTPAHHLAYAEGGCSVCRLENRQQTGKKVEWSFARWKKASIEKYGERFDYSRSRKDFQTTKRPKISIFCTEHQREFLVFPEKHLLNKSGGCVDCRKKNNVIETKSINRKSKKTKSEEIDDFLLWFNSNRSKNLEIKSEIFDVRQSVVFKCRKHDALTNSVPKSLQKYNQFGCKICAREMQDAKRRINFKKASAVLKEHLPSQISIKQVIHSKGSHTKIQLFCDEHGDLEPRLMSDLKRKNNIFCRGCHGLESKKKIVISENKNLMSLLSPSAPPDVLQLSQKDQKVNIDWVCKDRGHEFISTAYKLFKSEYSCPECKIYKRSVECLYPEIAKEYDGEKNKIPVSKIAAGSSDVVSWVCSKDSRHKFERAVHCHTHLGYECPFCTGKRVLEKDSLYQLRKDLMEEWDWSANQIDPKTLTISSDYKASWICSTDKRHKFKGRVANRTNQQRKGGCPICAGYIVDSTNNLEAVYPQVAKFWHPTKNLNLTPKDVFCKSKKRVWWKCEQGPDHEWQGTIFARTQRSQKCIFCLNQKVSATNSLSTLFPEISKEWHPTKNGDLSPDKTLAMSGKRVWWQCARNPEHEWRTIVAQRTSSGTECPGCIPNPKSKIEIEIAAELKLFFNELDIFDDQIFVEGKKIMPDIKINSRKLVVEYDGWYWHKNKENQDRRKTDLLKRFGWDVVRLREVPLFPLGTCVVFDPQHKKHSVDKLLILLADRGYLKKKEIETYLKHDSLINRAQYDQWLDNAISEKYIFRSQRRKKTSGN